MIYLQNLDITFHCDFLESWPQMFNWLIYILFQSQYQQITNMSSNEHNSILKSFIKQCFIKFWCRNPFCFKTLTNKLLKFKQASFNPYNALSKVTIYDLSSSDLIFNCIPPFLLSSLSRNASNINYTDSVPSNIYQRKVSSKFHVSMLNCRYHKDKYSICNKSSFILI